MIQDENFYEKMFEEDVFTKKDRSVRCYFHDYEFSSKIGMHTHDFYELNVIIRGKGVHHIEKNSFVMKSGTVFLIPPFVKHGYTFEDKDFSILHILFKNSFFERNKVFLSAISGYNIMFEIEPHFRLQKEKKTNFVLSFNIDKEKDILNNFEELASLETKETSNIQSRQELLSLYIISSLCEKIEKYHDNDKKVSVDSLFYYVMNAVEYLQKNYNEKFDVERMCRISHMSRSSFFRYFRKYFGCTPLQYLYIYRIKHAKEFLLETDKNIATIAQDCGFFDSANFIHVFKRIEGVSPLKYKQNFMAKNKAN